MTLIFAFLAAHIGAIVGVLGFAVTGIAAWFHGNASGKATATAQLQPQVDAAKSVATAAQTVAERAQANADASAAGTQAVVNKSDAAQEVSGKTDAELRKQVSDEFGS